MLPMKIMSDEIKTCRVEMWNQIIDKAETVQLFKGQNCNFCKKYSAMLAQVSDILLGTSWDWKEGWQKFENKNKK
jgi:coenzyme F420-reducing hydrogenase beta subunit